MAEYKELSSRKAILTAMARYDEMGREAFLSAYGFGAAETYIVRHDGRTYDSKAILGVAYGFQYPERGPLAADSFSGGRGHAATHLFRLGFDVAGLVRQEEHWSLDEVEAIVCRFFAMLAEQDATSYSRARHLELAADELPGRNDSAISRKISNINAILFEMDLPRLRGFGQLANKQALLQAIVYDWISDRGDIFGDAPPPPPLHDASRRTPPPEARTVDAVRAARRPVCVDFAARDERNRQLGRAGEAWAFAQLQQELADAGRPDLATKTVWVSDAVGDGLGYDIASFTADGSPILVEVKTTNGGVGTSFLVSANEVRKSGEAPNRYVLMRVYDFAGDIRYYWLTGSLEETCRLRPATYLAVPS